MDVDQWRYRGAIAIGFLIGAIAFILKESVTGSTSRDFLGLAMSMTAGIVGCCAVTFFRNLLARRALRLDEQRRQIQLPVGASSE